MDLSGLIPIFIVLLILLIIVGLVMTLMRYMGFDIPSLIVAIRGTRRTKMEIQPRDHYDRWVEGHRRSAKDNRPAYLRWLYMTGDEDVPAKKVGKIKGIEKWKTTNIIYVKASILQWSAPYLVPEAISSDIHGRNLWVRCRGFSLTHPVRLPIPLATEKDVKKLVNDAWDDFRFFFELQNHADIQENMAWGIDQAMQPPYRALRMAAEVQQPAITEVPKLKEEELVGRENN